MKATKFIMYIALQLISLAILMMAVSYLTDWLRNTGFFADVKIADPKAFKSQVDPDYTWGYRHYIYTWLGFFLFLCSLARIITWAANYANKHFNT